MMEIIVCTLRRVSPCRRCTTGSMLGGSCTACGCEVPDAVPETIMETLEDAGKLRVRNPSTSYRGTKVAL